MCENSLKNQKNVPETGGWRDSLLGWLTVLIFALFVLGGVLALYARLRVLDELVPGVVQTVSTEVECTVVDCNYVVYDLLVAEAHGNEIVVEYEKEGQIVQETFFIPEKNNFDVGIGDQLIGYLEPSDNRVQGGPTFYVISRNGKVIE